VNFRNFWAFLESRISAELLFENFLLMFHGDFEMVPAVKSHNQHARSFPNIRDISLQRQRMLEEYRPGHIVCTGMDFASPRLVADNLSTFLKMLISRMGSN